MDKVKYPVGWMVAKDFVDEAWLLCFDEFQVTDIASAAVMKEVFHNMFRMGAVMVTTSNRLPEGMLCCWLGLAKKG